MTNKLPVKGLTKRDLLGGNLSSEELVIAEKQEFDGLLSDEEREISKSIAMPRLARRVRWE